MRADEAAADLAAGQEHRRRRAVIGPPAAVLRHRAAELGEGHQHDAIEQFLPPQIVEKRRHGIGQLPQQRGVIVALTGMVVEAARFLSAQFGAENANPQIGADQLGDRAKSARQVETADTRPPRMPSPHGRATQSAGWRSRAASDAPQTKSCSPCSAAWAVASWGLGRRLLQDPIVQAAERWHDRPLGVQAEGPLDLTDEHRGNRWDRPAGPPDRPPGQSNRSVRSIGHRADVLRLPVCQARMATGCCWLWFG